jgi:Xaa-Pro aminopeptidase
MPTAPVTSQLTRRLAAAADAWGLTDEIVLVGAGDPIPVPGRGDLTYPFRAHSEYLYLTDVNRPGGVLGFDPDEGWFEFEAAVDAAERLWLGTPAAGPGGLTTRELAGWLRSRSGRPIACLGIAPHGVSCRAERSDELRGALDRIRRRKDELELERMRRAENATRAAFAAAAAALQEGVSERAVQIELEAEAFRHDTDAMAYDTIVAGGPNAAALHFAPGPRVFRDGELVLIDAGADVSGYASDITRTYPVDAPAAE